IYTYVCVCVCVRAYEYVCVCVCVCVCVITIPAGRCAWCTGVCERGSWTHVRCAGQGQVTLIQPLQQLLLRKPAQRCTHTHTHDNTHTHTHTPTHTHTHTHTHSNFQVYAMRVCGAESSSGIPHV